MKESYSRSLFLPGRTLLITSLLYLLLGCAAFFFETVFLVWLLAGIGLVPFILSDLLLLLLPGDRLQAERIIPYSLAQANMCRSSCSSAAADGRCSPFPSVFSTFTPTP